MRISFQYQSMIYQESLRHSLNELMKADAQSKLQDLIDPESSPADYIAAYNITRYIENLEQFNKNAANANTWLSNSDDDLQRIIKLVSQARDDLALNGKNGTRSKEDMRAIAHKALGIYDELLGIANSKYMGNYIFSGHKTNVMPFSKKDNMVSSLVQVSGKGGNVVADKTFADISEFHGGEYRVKVHIQGDTGYITIQDKYGKSVFMDTNGSDDTAGSGNSIGYKLTFKVEPGAVINTGRGFAIQLPKEMEDGDVLEYKLNYEAGSDTSYYGDDGVINNRIGVNQNVPINLTGRELFMKSAKILRGSVFNTVNGIPLTSSTRFSDIKGANSKIGDSISISGRDHLGRPVGAAIVTAPENVKLDLSKATKEERTLTIGYGNKYYQIEIPAKGYKDQKELVNIINHELSQALYAGSMNSSSTYNSVDAMADENYTDIKAGLTTKPNDPNFVVDLSKEVKVVLDGGRLSFITSNTGDKVYLSVTGGKHNPLGFNDKTVAGMGKDVVFEIGENFDSDKIHLIKTTHKDLDLTGTDDVVFMVNGKKVVVKNLNTATTKEEKELLIDKALREAGFGFTVSASLKETSTPGKYDVTFSMQNINVDRNTALTTMYYSGIAGMDKDYQSAVPARNSVSRERTVNDFMNFLENLYGGGVEVSIEDGRLTVKDLLAGESKLSLYINENNEGISMPNGDNGVIVSGKYKGIEPQELGVKIDEVMNADGSLDLKVTVTDKKGHKIFERDYVDYKGGPIEFAGGLLLTVDKMLDAPGTASRNFTLNLTPGSSLNFGDMNTIQEGNNANAFTSIMNLYDALNNGIQNNERDAPWLNNYKSPAKPYFDGKFYGNYNAKWKFDVLSEAGMSDSYLQAEFVKSSGNIKYLTGQTEVKFEVQTYDNVTKSFTKTKVAVDLTGVTNSTEMALAIEKAINNNPTFFDQKVHARVQDGKVLFESGSGTKSINILPDRSDPASVGNFMYMMGLDKPYTTPMAAKSTETSSFNFHHFDGTAWKTTAIVVAPWASPEDAVASVNSQLTAAGITATASLSEGKLTFSSSEPIYYDNVVSPDNSLGITNNSLNATSGNRKIVLDMKELSVEQRTLTFKYNDGTEKTGSIVLEAREYENMADFLKSVNNALSAKGMNTAFTAVSQDDGKLAFIPSDTVTHFAIENDHDGFLGFPKTGDKISVKVTDDKGRIVQNLEMDTSNKEYEVADGMLLGFDRGKIQANDSFTGAVGSGIEYEIGVLDLVQKQLLEALTKVGNRQARVESTMDFNKMMIKTSTNQKAVYLGGTDDDKVAAVTRLEYAKRAYELAMASTASIMKISILDFLR